MYKFLFFMFLSILMVSCDSDVDAGKFVVGSDYLSIKNKVISIDTMTVTLSTIRLDSLVTSSESRILVGNYDDPLFGTIKADSYFQVLTSSFNLYSQNSDTDATGYVFDSIAMIMRYDDYYYADTTKVQTLNVHRVLQKFKPNKEDNSFYNNSVLNYDNSILGSITYKPKPIGKDSINIKLDNNFGLELFNKFKNNEISDESDLTEYLKGFMITSSNSSSSSVIGFNMSSTLRLYYSKVKGDTEESYSKDFIPSNAAKQFNVISSNRDDTLIKDLPSSNESLPSVYSGNKGFVQSGTGLVCRINFPNVKQLRYLAEKGAIVDAKLLLKPVKYSYSELFPLPQTLGVYLVDNMNRIKSKLTNANNETVTAALNRSDNEFGDDVQYEVLLGSYLQKEMLKESDKKSGLLITMPILSKVVDRVVLGDQNNKENKLKLQIYYITY
ncbi:DUF4270 family protein [Flavobacterium sp. IMCC34518]|uniref:DUF4270 family protein n=1 Tax=Flavobacterium sp. IMCC34518 TaxID=3003623 RepID=UPI0022AC5DBD|nr:DUF4270 family protein [Flavobacterium sp. IMCC34518]